ncbi:MAG: 50S ribosomal protein L11 methyltransferase [Bacteroidaceae bacterium]|nr:50S ribosomal protein L11 methyltransferase [Bacteroidaceae bacterium]
MKYSVATFVLEPYSEAAGDVLAALLADIGFDSFEPTADGLQAYVQTNLLDAEALAAVVADFPLLGISINYNLSDAPDENWNAAWEQEHSFEPIALPGGEQVTIVPRQAFGSGEHATTRMMIQLLSSIDLSGLTVIDAGCGTGILGFAAMLMGASSLMAYDIDEWSVKNARDNLKLNAIEPSGVEFRLGDSSVLTAADSADILLANINRNILQADLPTFVAHLRRGGKLLLSGFYENDVPLLVDQASALGLSLSTKLSDGEWRALAFDVLKQP